MKIVKKIILSNLILAFLIFFVLFNTPSSHASTSKTITATIRLSICGNNIIEGGEDCEGNNLNHQTCKTLGYDSGSLKCDIACDFDTSNCKEKKDSGSDSDTSSSPNPAQTKTTTEETEQTIIQQVIQQTLEALGLAGPERETSVSHTVEIPTFLKSFDSNKDNRIDKTEMVQSIRAWVDEWQKVLTAQKNEAEKFAKQGLMAEKKCDLNKDNKCNIADFSILLYYIQ